MRPELYHSPDFRERIMSTPRVAIVADGREFFTSRAVFSFSGRNPERLQPAGIIVPGGEFDDGEIHRLAELAELKPGRSDMTGVPIADDRDEYHTMGMKFFNYLQDFEFHHAPYDGKRLRDPEYRQAYSQRLLELIESTHPDITVLANLKVILDRLIAEALGESIFNLHPSFLPLLKGYKPEHRAVNLQENPHSAGWTMHQVRPDLDGGETIAQQRVEIEPLDEERLLSMSEEEKKVYFHDREERLRLQIIKSEARYLPEILAILSAKDPSTGDFAYNRRIVYGAEAFVAEGRPGFESSPEYLKQLKKEREEMPEGVEPQPYGRVLFETDVGWQTMEEILNIEPISTVSLTNPVRRWNIFIPGDKVAGFEDLRRILGVAEAGELYNHRISQEIGGWRAQLTTSADLSEATEGLRRILGTQVESELMGTHVGTPRKPVEWTWEDGDFDWVDQFPSANVDLVNGTITTDSDFPEDAAQRLEEGFDVTRTE